MHWRWGMLAQIAHKHIAESAHIIIIKAVFLGGDCDVLDVRICKLSYSYFLNSVTHVNVACVHVVRPTDSGMKQQSNTISFI